MEDLNFDDEDTRTPICDRSYVKTDTKKQGQRASKPRSLKWRDIELLNEQRQLQRQLQDVY